MDRQPSYGALVTRHQPGLERQREPTVKAASPLPRQRPADGFVHEGVGEGETLGHLLDQSGGERLIQGVEHAGAAEVTGLAEEVDGKRRPDRRGHGEDVPAGAAHQRQPAEHDGPHTGRHLESPRHAHPGIVELTPRHQQTDQLDHEERIPARTPVQRLAGGRRCLGPLDRGDESTNLGRGQPVQLDHGRAGPTSQLGHRLPECGVGAGRWGAVGGDEQERSAAGFPGDELEQPQRPAIGVVEIVEHDGQGLVGGSGDQKPGDGVEHQEPRLVPGPGGGDRQRRQAGAELWDQGRHLGGAHPQLGRQPNRFDAFEMAAERLRPRPEGGRVAPAGGRPQDLDPLVGCERCQLLDQTGLADAGLAADQGDLGGWLPGGVDRGTQRGELRFPAHQGGHASQEYAR